MSNRLFEFGQYWNTGTFFFYIAVAICVTLLCKRGAMINASSPDRKSTGTNSCYLLAFILLWLLYTFKSIYVGSDSISYVKAFLNATELNFDMGRFLTLKEKEPLYQIFNYVIRSFTDNYTVYFAFCGLIIVSGQICFIRNFWKANSSFLFLIPMIVGFSGNLSGLRSALGTAFLLFSLCALKNKKIGKSIFLTIIGTMFHYTIIVNLGLIVFYLFLNNVRRFRRKYIVLLSILLVALLSASITFLSAILSMTKYDYYIRSGGGSWYGYWYLILGAGAAILLLRYYKGMAETEKVSVVSSLFMGIALVAIVGVGAYRIPNYYLLPRLAMWGMFMPRFCAGKSKKAVTFFWIVAVAFVGIYLLFRLSRMSAPFGFEYQFRNFAEEIF